jgi:glycosyltransferase involved in cell wall biosynthesis
MNKSCAIFFYEGYVSLAPTIINLSESMKQCGYSVVIYGAKSLYSEPEMTDEQVPVVYFQRASDVPIVLTLLKFLSKIKLDGLVETAELLAFIIQFLAMKSQARMMNKPQQETINIGVDRFGAILALVNLYLFKQKFIHLSLEIWNATVFGKLTRAIIFVLERLAYTKAECTVIQDEDRLRSLCTYAHYKPVQVFYLPNSPSSSASNQEDLKESNYFREKFDLSEEKFPCILLQAGMIRDEVCSKTLAHTFASLNEGIALILHSSQGADVDDPYIKSLKEINTKNLFLSLEPLPYEQISRVVTAATIGLAFYENVNDNFSKIAMASGKLAQYLKYGKPVLTTNQESLVKIVDQYKFGLTIKDPSDPLEMKAAIETILENYSFYSQNAKICFESEYDFAKKVKPLLSFMQSLS